MIDDWWHTESVVLAMRLNRCVTVRPVWRFMDFKSTHTHTRGGSQREPCLPPCHALEPGKLTAVPDSALLHCPCCPPLSSFRPWDPAKVTACIPLPCCPPLSSFRPWDLTRVTNDTGTGLWVNLPQAYLINGKGFYGDCQVRGLDPTQAKSLKSISQALTGLGSDAN